jgi:inhibitor of KinA sporulation pathway (predicted exonuclease)
VFGLPREIVIFDLECTTWEGAAQRNWSGPGEHRELVQLGAALVETNNFREVENLKLVVKPVFNPVLSQYFVDLTGITQEMVDVCGLDFPHFMRIFVKWCGTRGLYCFDKIGERIFDRDVLVENCRLHDMEFPFEPDAFNNINYLFFQNGYEVKQSGQAPLAFGEIPPARSHDALNDVRGLIRGLQLLKERGPKK